MPGGPDPLEPRALAPTCSTVYLLWLQQPQFLVETSLILAGGGKWQHPAPSEQKGRCWSEESRRWKEGNGTHRVNENRRAS